MIFVLLISEDVNQSFLVDGDSFSLIAVLEIFVETIVNERKELVMQQLDLYL